MSLLSNTLWVSAIEQSAAILAAPHQAPPRGLAQSACPVEASRYTGAFRGQPISGVASFAVEDGICIGTLALDGDAKAWFDEFPQKDAPHLRLVGLDARGGLSRAALVTPIGVYDLRAQGDGWHRAAMGSESEMRVRFEGLPEDSR